MKSLNGQTIAKVISAISRRFSPANSRVCAALSLAAIITVPAGATTISFSDFSDVSSLTLNGDAITTTTSDGAVLRLASAVTWQSGSAFGTNTINAAGFSTYFTFRITNPGGELFDDNTISGADGVVFVIQSMGSSIGGGGMGIGYANISPSVGVEFDTWHNPGLNDPSSNHIGIDINGNLDHGAGSPDTVNVGNDSVREDGFDNGNIWHSWIDYNGTTLQIRISENGVRPDDPILSKDLNIPSILGVTNAYVGFTSGTGLDWGDHDILTWEYRDAFNPIPSVPLPAAVWLFGSGLLGIIWVSMHKNAAVSRQVLTD